MPTYTTCWLTPARGCGTCDTCRPPGSKSGDLTGPKHLVTVGRKKRKRKKGAGSGVKIKSHSRSPRGANKGKKRVRVDGHARGKPPRKGRRRKR